MLIRPKAGGPAKIKVIGVGGGGSNAVAGMVHDGGIEGVEFIAVNTDAQALLHSPATVKLQIGDMKTGGLGSGGDPEVGKLSAEESTDKIKEEIGNTDLVFITAGMGGGTGTGAAPIIAKIAREAGALVIAVVNKPFVFEGTKRANTAKAGIAELRQYVDTLITVPNQRILQLVDQKTSVLDALKRIDSVLYQGVKGLSELITLPGLINVDFADVKTIMQNSGSALMGIGLGKGENRALDAVQEAMSSPLLDTSIDGAKGILIHIEGGPDLTMPEVNEAAMLINKAADPNADIIFGANISAKLQDTVKVTLIATRFDDKLSVMKFRQEFETPTGQIQRTLEMPTKMSSDITQKTTTPLQRTKRPIQSDPDDPFDIPAFLRRKN